MTIRMRGNYVFSSLEAKRLKGLGINDYGDIWYVDSVNGNSGYSGKSWDKAKATVAQALALASAGDVIAIIGSFSEAITIASTKSNLAIVGAGLGPYQARWTGDADAKLITVQASYVLIKNIRFQAPAYAADRAACAIKPNGANYLRVQNCRFQGKTGSQAAIYSPACDSDNVEIDDCEFIYHNTATYGAAIVGVEAGGLCYSSWKIRRNIFNSCVIGIDIAGRVCQILDNIVHEYGINPAGAVAQLLAKGIDLSGTNSGGNVVKGNQLGGAYTSTLYVDGASGDQWAGNYVPVTETTAPYGLSVAVPA